MTDIKTELAAEAAEIVNGARRKGYGTPEDNFERIAHFWNAYMASTGRVADFTAQDVAPMMRLMKEARLCETPYSRDSLVDVIGYALCQAEITGVPTKKMLDAAEKDG